MISDELRKEWGDVANAVYQRGKGTKEELNLGHLSRAFNKIYRAGFYKSDNYYRNLDNNIDIIGRINKSKPKNPKAKTAVVYDCLLKSLPAIQTLRCPSGRDLG